MTQLDQVTLRRRGAGLIGCDHQRSAGGYTMFAPQTANGNVYLVDLDGQVAHNWKMPFRPGRDGVLLANGNLGYNGNHPDSPDLYGPWSTWHGGAFMEVTPLGDVVWEHTDLMHHHDAQWLANGNLLYTTVEPMPPEFAARVQGGSHAHDLPDGTIYGDVVKEVNRAGETVWLWKIWEHVAPEEFPIHPFFDRTHWPLINSVSLTRDGVILMSLRTTSGVIGVDRATKKMVWKLGHDVVAQQHAPYELANGNVLLFDNGNFRPGVSTPFSRVIEVDRASRQVVWQWADPVRPSFFSPFMGGAERLANGNTLITESSTGRLFEVMMTGEVVWEYVVPFFAEYPDARARGYVPGEQNTCFRAHRYQREQLPWL